MIWLIISFVIGLIFGGIVGITFKEEKPIGTLKVDRSDPDDGPYLFLELETDPRYIMSQKRVNLKVDVKNYISHE